VRKGGISASAITKLLSEQTGDSAVWPDDATFHNAWVSQPLYNTLNSPKLVHIFTRLNQTFMSAKAEVVLFAMPPTIEHIMPQNWVANWPLGDGSEGMELSELYGAPETDPRAVATRNKEDKRR
jgi:hypothetical protein